MAPRPLTVAVLAGSGGEAERIGAVLATEEIEVAAPEREPDAIVVSCLDPAADVKCRVGEVKRRFPGTPVVALLADADPARATRGALGADAEGAVFAERVDEALAATVRAVAAGQVALPPARYRHAPAVVLSHREREVLRLAVEGWTNDSIASALYISRSTVKSHLTAAFAKLSVGSRSEAAAVLSSPDALTGSAA